MGTSLRLECADIRIPAPRKQDALTAIHETLNDIANMSGGSSTGERWWAFTETEGIRAASTIEEVLYAWRYDAATDPASGDIIGLDFVGQNVGDDVYLFKALAPFIEDGGTLEFRADDHHWRWVFQGGRMYEQAAIISWSENKAPSW